MGTDLNPGMRVRLELMEERIIMSSLVESVEDDCILIHAPSYQGSMYPLSGKEKLLLLFTLEDKMYAISADFIDRATGDNISLIKIKTKGKKKEHQQRDCYRLPCSIPTIVKKGWKDDNFEDEPIEATILNFSDGGILLAANTKLDRGDRIHLSFDIGQEEVVNAKVVRMTVMEEGLFTFNFGIQFVIKDKAQKQRFYKFIMDRQMEQRRRQTSSR